MLLLVDEAEDDLILARYFYLDVPVDFQGDGLDRGCVGVNIEIPPVPGLLPFAFVEVVAQVSAQAQPRPRRHPAATASGPGVEAQPLLGRVTALLLLPALLSFSFLLGPEMGPQCLGRREKSPREGEASTRHGPQPSLSVSSPSQPLPPTLAFKFLGHEYS